MASAKVMSAAPKPKNRTAEEIDLIKSDVSFFASSLGFCLPLPSAAAGASGGSGGGGFDDSDFRKTGPLKPPKYRANSGENDKDSEKNTKPQSIAKPHPLQIDPFPDPDEKKSNHPKLPLMKAKSLSGHWYGDAEELEGTLLRAEAKKLPVMRLEELNDLVVKKKELAERLLGQYTREYEVARKKSRDMRLLETTARSGTSVDRISAFTCLVEDNPMANMRALDALLSMVTSKVGKRYAFNGYEALKELFLLRLLPNRKLKCLVQRPLQNLPENKNGYSLLLFWYWEECLKQRFERFVISLEEAVKDVLPNLKDKAMKTVYALLKSKPEQERRLLSSLVNKLGDPERKASSNAAYQLSCLLSEHPNMKEIVINEVDSFLFRPHNGLRAKYYAVNFLGQILLSKRGDGPKIAKRLVEVYFALFQVLIFEYGNGNMHANKKSHEETGKSGSEGRNYKRKTTSSLKSNKKKSSQEIHVEMDSRLLSALLTGVNRAFPFVSSEEADDILEVQTPILFKLAYSENFNVGVQALMLLYQITTKNQIASDRFYRALYAKLLTPAAMSSSKAEMFLGLLVKAMKNDINLRRVSAFSKRLIQVALLRPPQYACGCLFLLSEVLKAKPPLWRVMLQKESIDDELEHFEDILEEDQNMPPAKNTKLNNSVITQNKKMSDFEDDTDNSNSDKENSLNNGPRAKSASDISGKEAQSHYRGSSFPGGYDPRHREPVYCNADRTGLWELTILASHVHPSVEAMARTLLSGANIVYNGDPLNDLSLGAFLDKFMEKKPRLNKKAEGIWHGGSQIAPTKKLDTSHHLIGDEILQLAEEEIPPEDVVFHRFYMNKTSSSKKQKAKKKASTDEQDADLLIDENEEEEDEEEIDSILGAGPLLLGEEEGEFDYDDLSRVIVEDDEDLLGHGSDAEDEQTSDVAASDDDDDDDNQEEDGDIKIWGADPDEDNTDYNDNGNENPSYTRRKMNAEKKSRPSPFASLEDFEHLMPEVRDITVAVESGKKYKSKSEKKRKRKRYD